MSVASSSAAGNASRRSQSSRRKKKEQQQQHPTIQQFGRGESEVASTANTGPSSPKVRDRPGSTEPPPGRVDAVRPRNGYNQQASSSRPTITVETVLNNKGKGGTGSTSSYDEITVGDGGGEEWHSPTNVTPDDEGYDATEYEDDGYTSDEISGDESN